MKRNKLIVGSFALIALSAVLVTSPWKVFTSQGSYFKKSLPSLESASANDALAWLRERYIDVETVQPISAEKLQLIKSQVQKLERSKSIQFTEQGPDNIGGRTRAILPDRTNINRVWAGSVSGGLFVSTNRGDYWERVDNFINAGANPYVSGMTQTIDGTIYVATGSLQENVWPGSGIWYSTDFGDTWSQVPGTSNKTCSDVTSSDVDNYIWFTIGGSTGVKKWKIGETALTTKGNGNGECKTIQISKDGQVLVGGFGGNRTYISNDGGETWQAKYSTTVQPGLVSTNGVSRIEYAISATKNENDKYTMYAIRTGANLNGMNVSYDNGNTWDQFIGASGTPSNLDIYRDQGTYNSIVTVSPTNTNRILIGGIDIWQWEQTSNNPPSGGFEQMSFWALSPTSSKYVHADNHEMKWDNLNRLYVGNDGGIGITDDYGATWYPANRGYNVTQFYGIAFDRDGAVMGGAQDNGTMYNDHTLSTFKEFRSTLGGDGFECEISFFNPRIMFGSVYNNSISRSGDKGQNWSAFIPDTSSGFPALYTPFGSSNYPFHTELGLAEYYDLSSKDSVMFVCTKNYPAGSKIRIPSLTTGDSMNYTTPVALYFDDTLYYEPSLTQAGTLVVNTLNGQNIYLDNFMWTPFTSASGANPPLVGDSLMVNFPTGADTVVVGSLGNYFHYFGLNSATGETISMGNDTVAYNVAWDTLIVQDPYQSWFVVYSNTNGGELWGTRDALRLSAKTIKWVCLARGIGGPASGASNDNSNFDVEFSRDLDYCYILTNSGVTRLNGLKSVYSTDPMFYTKAGYHGGSNLTTPPTQITSKLLSGTGSYQGLAINPNNEDDIILFAGFSGTNRRSLNATSANPTFTSLMNITSANVACYDGIIDRNDADVIVVGTSEGVFITEDGGATWSNASAGFEGTPVFEVRQSWRSWSEGNGRPGEIYIGTYGRGIWSTDAYLGITENNAKGNSAFKTKLKTYPNPTTDNTTLTFDLEDRSNVYISVYNISGKLVKSISQKNVEAGSQTITIDGTDLMNGTYIVKFIAGKQNETVKFIKM